MLPERLLGHVIGQRVGLHAVGGHEDEAHATEPDDDRAPRMRLTKTLVLLSELPVGRWTAARLPL